MRILAIDLAYSGPTGWVLWDDGDGSFMDPFAIYGQFSVRKLGFIDTIVSLHDQLLKLLREASKEMSIIVAFEITDWHRSLRGPNDKVGYSIERKAQRCLGRAEASMILAAQEIMAKYANVTYNPITKLIPIGANEAKREFLGGSGGSKIACARALSQEYRRFEFRDNKAYPLYDLTLNKKISNNVSDAFVIAEVVAKREILNARMDS